ncbi:hypothetical protein TWF730_003632 [Orbilia blumenaviensis]|uniref:Uncharacterized protein n=1 Tax=Orbilia blumenaviensis TaxID=1796055 RepID=A0AAV9U396_9PEZI
MVCLPATGAISHLTVHPRPPATNDNQRDIENMNGEEYYDSTSILSTRYLFGCQENGNKSVVNNFAKLDSTTQEQDAPKKSDQSQMDILGSRVSEEELQINRGEVETEAFESEIERYDCVLTKEFDEWAKENDAQMQQRESMMNKIISGTDEVVSKMDEMRSKIHEMVYRTDKLISETNEVISRVKELRRRIYIACGIDPGPMDTERMTLRGQCEDTNLRGRPSPGPANS